MSTGERRFTGGWLITRHDNGTPGSIKSVLTFAEGGAFVGLDLDPAAPPYLGSWETEENNRFVATFWTPVTDPSGNVDGTARVKATGRVTGDTISGTYTDVVFFKSQPNVHGSGTFHGTRIDPD